MPSMLVHGFEETWVSSDSTRLGCELDTLAVAGQHSMRLTATAGAAGATATYTPAAPLALSQHEELRFWSYADRPANGSPDHPFLLQLEYTDAGDAAGEEHRWLMPVNRPRVWEQHRIGIVGDRRSAITSMSLRCLTDRPFRVFVDELLATSDRPLPDAERALIDLLSGSIALPGVSGVPVQPAAVSANVLMVDANRRFRTGNRLALTSAGQSWRHVVTSVSHAATTTTLGIDPPLAAATGSGDSVSVVVPVVVEESPHVPPAAPGDLPDPVLLLALTDQREELERAWSIPQRDSFRPRGELTVCSIRPPARPVLLEYQILAAATDREQSLTIREAVLQRVSVDGGLRVNGVVLPVRTLLPPPLETRDRAVVAPVLVHVGTRVELGERGEVPWVRSAQIKSGQLSAPHDQEGIVLRL